MDDELLPLRLAYDESVCALGDQASALESLRSRAGTVFAATALVISFLGGQALVRSEESPLELSLSSAGGWATTLFIVLALLTLAILWPYRIRFSVSAGAMLAILDEREQQSPVSAEEALRELALRFAMRRCTTTTPSGSAGSFGVFAWLSFSSWEKLRPGSRYSGTSHDEERSTSPSAAKTPVA